MYSAPEHLYLIATVNAIQNGSNWYTQVQRCIAILYTEAIVFYRRQNSEISKPWHRIKVPNYYLLSKKLLSINQKYIPQKFIICIMETYVQYITTILCLKIVVLYREHCCTCNVLLRKRSLNRWACLYSKWLKSHLQFYKTHIYCVDKTNERCAVVVPEGTSESVHALYLRVRELQ